MICEYNAWVVYLGSAERNNQNSEHSRLRLICVTIQYSVSI